MKTKMLAPIEYYTDNAFRIQCVQKEIVNAQRRSSLILFFVGDGPLKLCFNFEGCGQRTKA
jgi:hypothetical protein